MKNTARKQALFILQDCRKNGAWPNEKLRSALTRSGLGQRDRALTTRLCYGVFQNRELIDFYISEYCSTKLKKLHPAVLDILRLGVYQIIFLDKIPDRAAVNEAVELTKSSASPAAASLVNAVLTRISKERENLPEPASDDPTAYISTKYSHPKWIADKAVELLGGDAEKWLAANNSAVPLYVQINTLKTGDVNAVCRILLESGSIAKPHEWLDGCIEITGTGGIVETRAYRDGLIMIQDPAARLAVIAAAPKPGDFVIDACAAPGGKAFASAMLMRNEGKILALDIHEHKIKPVAEDARRLGISIIEARAGNAAAPNTALFDLADVVLADVPCSGLGIIRKKPDIRYKAPEPLGELPDIQLKILMNVSQYVKRGGTLLYSTCTVLPEENEDVVFKFLESSSDFKLEAFTAEPVGHVPGGYITLWPHIHGTDGFFICKLVRNN